MKLNVTASFPGTLYIYPRPKGSLLRFFDIEVNQKETVDLPKGKYFLRFGLKEIELDLKGETDVEFDYPPINRSNIIKLQRYQKQAKALSDKVFNTLKDDDFLNNLERGNGDSLGNAGSDLERASRLIRHVLESIVEIEIEAANKK